MSRRGFTLIELLVVVSIILVSIAMLLPAIEGAKGAARRASCQNNLKQVSLALLIYHHDAEVFPPGFVDHGRTRDGRPSPGWGWMAVLLPNMEQASLSRMIDLEAPVESADFKTARIATISTLLCSEDFRVRENVFIDTPGRTGLELCEAAPSSYVGSFGTGDPEADPSLGDGVFFRNSRIGLDALLDGSSTTILVGERSKGAGPAIWAGVIPGQLSPPKGFAPRPCESRRARGWSSARRWATPGRTPRRPGGPVSPAVTTAAPTSPSATAACGS